MQKKTRNWVLFTLGIYAFMTVLVPSKSRRKLYPYGLCFGFIHAILLNWYSVKYKNLWQLPGDIKVKGIPVFTCISWIPPSILFSYYFPYGKDFFLKALYILFFASGTTIAQYIHGMAGMWDSKNWKPIFTLPLSIMTHLVMTIGTWIFGTGKIRNG